MLKAHVLSPGKRHSSLLCTNDEQEQMQTTPPKNARLEEDGLATPQTPSPSRLNYQMNAIGAALDHYFSPKKRSPGRVTGKTSQRKLNFTNEESSDDEQGETEKPSHSNLVSNFDRLAAVKHCFDKLDDFLPSNLFEEKQQQHFNRWQLYLRSGEFNILVHGLGSKRKIVDDFRKVVNSSDTSVFVVDGLNNGLTAQKLFEHITENIKIAKVRERKMSLKEWATALSEKLGKHLEDKGQRLVLLVHNLDSPSLRPREQQEAIAALVQGRERIRILASVDHVNPVLIWTKSLLDAFGWLYFPLSTLHCYGHEVLTGCGKLLGLNKKRGTARERQHTIGSLDVFWLATTQNQRKMLEQLALYAPLQSEKGRRDPLSIPRFCQILKEEFATTSETVLRQQLIEFSDHGLVHQDQDGNIQLTVDRQLLMAFLDSKTK